MIIRDELLLACVGNHLMGGGGIHEGIGSLLVLRHAICCVKFTLRDCTTGYKCSLVICKEQIRLPFAGRMSFKIVTRGFLEGAEWEN